MQIDTKGLQIIENFEGFLSCPYHDQIGKITIGIGTTYYPNGKDVTMSDPCITHDQAMEYLQSYLKPVCDKITQIVTKPINQNQFDSLCSFSYNLGIGALETSTLLKKINVDPSDPTIRQEFEKWTHAGGKVLHDLVERRAQEASLYFISM